MGLGPFPPHLHSSLYLPKKTEKLINDVTTLSFLLSTVFCYLYSILSSTNTLPTTTRGLYIGPCTPQTLCLLFHPIISYHSLPTNKKMSNTSSIEELIPQLPSELQLEIRNRCIASRARQVLALCDHILQLEYNFGLINQFPNLEYPWNTPVYFREPVPWTPIFYVYLWYLFNNYHMPLLFKPDYFLSWGHHSGLTTLYLINFGTKSLVKTGEWLHPATVQTIHCLTNVVRVDYFTPKPTF